MGEDEDLSTRLKTSIPFLPLISVTDFVWLQCTRLGWLPLQYEQYSGYDPESLAASFA